MSVRERRAFWRSRPSGVLAASLTAAAIGGALVGLVGVAELSSLPVGVSALIFGFAAICSLGPNDLVKTLLCARALREQPAASAAPTPEKHPTTALEHAT
jgi:hypothetical protein